MLLPSRQQTVTIMVAPSLRCWQIRLYQWVCAAILGCFVWFASCSDGSVAIATPLAEQANPDTPSAIFSANCAACHAHGGNIIRRGKNLKLKALSRYGYDSAEAIEALVSQGKGAMPAYADRLSGEEIGAIAQYVLAQAKTGW
ncbi:MAG: c-type cytochrome [Cyanobacteria bacterium P01_D01_bin.105]